MSNKHKLLRLAESIHSRPHLITTKGFDAVAQYLDARNLNVLLMEEEGHEPIEEPKPEVVAGIGVLNLHGALTYKPVYGLCGEVGTSYQSLITQAQELIDNGVRTVVMDVDSPGGEGYGAFETADTLRAMFNAAGVEWIAYNDGDCASAAYAISCAADMVITNPAAESGSIGVLIALMNNSKALEKMGYQRTFISAGKQKIPFDSDGDWKPEFLAGLQDKVDAMYAQFVGHVSKHTGLSEDAIRDTEARMFMAEDALQLGLVNKVMTRSEFIDYIASKARLY